MSNSDRQAALEHLEARLSVATFNRDREASNEADLFLRKAAVAGSLASGNTVSGLMRYAIEDLRIRSALFNQALDETWLSYRLGPDGAGAAKEMLLEKLRLASGAAQKSVRDCPTVQSLGFLSESVWTDFRADCDAVESQMSLRLTEWVLQQTHAAPTQSASQTTTVTLSGNNNTVVAGLMHSSVELNLGAGGGQRLLDALETVRSEVALTQSLSRQDQVEVLELVADAAAEVQRSTPNKRKLTASLQGVATTIQTVGALREAYGVLRNAMALIGLLLP